MEGIRDLVHRALAGDPAALEGVVDEVKDDVYNLAVRMLGKRDDAEDATQEILVQVLTHLAQWRGDASFRTWVWRISTHHLLRARRSRAEEECTFEAIEGLIEAGAAERPAPALDLAELAVLEEELRIQCTEAMLLSIDRDHRIAWLLAEVFELDSNQAAEVLAVEAATYRKRLSRARLRLGTWMHANCGLVNATNACRCRRQLPVALELGVVDPANVEFARHPERQPPRLRRLGMLAAADEVERAAAALCEHPDYAAPDTIQARIRALIEAKGLRMFEA